MIEITTPKQRTLTDNYLEKNSPQNENIIIKDGKVFRYDPRTKEAYGVNLRDYKGDINRDTTTQDYYSEIAGRKYAFPLYDDAVEKSIDKNSFIAYYNN